MIVGFNREQNIFVEEPVCFNPSISKVSNNKGENIYRGSGVAHSNFSSVTEQ